MVNVDRFRNGDTKHVDTMNDDCNEKEQMLQTDYQPTLNFSAAKLSKSYKESKLNDTISDYLLCGILNELRILSADTKEKHDAEQNEAEWRYFAKCLDWFFFFVFILLFMLTSVCILVPSYLDHEKYAH